MKSRTASLIGSAVFLGIAPGSVAGLIPWWITRWSGSAPLPAVLLGAMLIMAGGAVLLDSFVRFAWQGLGTPAPIAPTQSLIVTGLYRHVRNPIYVAVTSLIVGQALLFESATLLLYGAAIWMMFHLFVVLHEEPVLAARFGADYARYRAHVPRWLPRVAPWRP